MNWLKKGVALLCLLAMMTGGSACREATENSGEPETEIGSRNEETTVDYSNDLGYLELEPVSIRNTVFGNFVFGEEGTALQIPLPVEWTVLPEDDGSYSMMREGRTAGRLYAGERDASMVILRQESFLHGDADCQWEILLDAEADSADARYYHRFVYGYTVSGVEHRVTLMVSYRELDDVNAQKCANAFSLVQCRTPNYLNALPLSANAKGKNILILGNSFVNSSKIGTILSQMCQGKPYGVEGVSVGYATVSKSWASYLPAMRNGEYAAVLMCGFYGESDVTAFYAYVEACKASGTPIAILPAHNEQYGGSAATKYPNVPFLDWKTEINVLIMQGVSWDDFCVDDAHKHSKPLAGYVGAHMIYRALFGENPPALSSYESLPHSYVAQKLGDYLKGAGAPILSNRVCYPLA